jgi:hydroxyacylglutathione hydrolase
MPLSVHQFPCLQDNYGFLVRDRMSKKTACIDTPDAKAILRELGMLGWKLDLIMNTHWHPDHAGGNAELQMMTGARSVGPAEVEKLVRLDRIVGHGDVVELGETRFEVIDTGGHTSGHITYHDEGDGIAFVGDTLFALGCGRLFEGTPQQMWASLSRLAALPGSTQVFCAHEYTAANARFALSVDDSPELAHRAREVFAARERGEPTVPTSIALERATNPFLRAGDAERFGELRRAKDGFRG